MVDDVAFPKLNIHKVMVVLAFDALQVILKSLS